MKPWNVEHGAGKITRPLRHNGTPYSGISTLALWMTYRQALELGANVRKGENGSLVVYANSIVDNETDEKTCDEINREIHFMKGYTLFNVEQIKGLPEP